MKKVSTSHSISENPCLITCFASPRLGWVNDLLCLMPCRLYITPQYKWITRQNKFILDLWICEYDSWRIKPLGHKHNQLKHCPRLNFRFSTGQELIFEHLKDKIVKLFFKFYENWQRNILGSIIIILGSFIPFLSNMCCGFFNLFWYIFYRSLVYVVLFYYQGVMSYEWPV